MFAVKDVWLREKKNASIADHTIVIVEVWETKVLTYIKVTVSWDFHRSRNYMLKYK